MTVQAFCPSCGTALVAGAAFCGACGKPTGSASAPAARRSLGRTIATAVIVLVAAFLVGAILPFENGQLLAVAVAALIAVVYILAAARR